MPFQNWQRPLVMKRMLFCLPVIRSFTKIYGILKLNTSSQENASGQFVKKFKPRLLVYLDPDNEYTNAYVEGSALQWRWALFFDGNGLVSLFKDKNYFVEELNSFFASSDSSVGRLYPGPYYWHGNEPDIHAAYLFNYAGQTGPYTKMGKVDT